MADYIGEPPFSNQVRCILYEKPRAQNTSTRTGLGRVGRLFPQLSMVKDIF